LIAFAGVTLLALLVLRFVGAKRSDDDAARALLETGKAAEAEATWASVTRREPTVPHVLALVQAHRRALAASALYETRPKTTGAPPSPAMEEEALAALVASLPPDVALVGRFALGSEEARDDLEAAAKREPPMPWANHALGVAARSRGEDLDAAAYFWREGGAFSDRSTDVDAAFQCWVQAGAWEIAQEKLDEIDPSRVPPDMRYALAVHDHDWRAALRALPAQLRAHEPLRFVWLAAIAALAWGFFCARLGQIGRRPRLRAPLYVIAFALGVLSVAPTLALIAVEQAKLHLVETGNAVRDLLFFVFGVGLREEGCKLLLFAPLLPILRRWGDKLDVLVCGAMVGLGFAAEENLGYLADENLHTGLARFLTANFLHVAMTGILASALDDFLRDPEKHGQDFMRASLTVVGLHGVYDFLLSHSELGGPYLAMGVFVILTKMFVDAVERARRGAERGTTPMETFVLALAVVTGACLAHAIDAVGVKHGIAVMAEGLLGEGVMVIVFGRVLSAL
jgi:RsiW-degrading membrane proteinase PrsW (M82 family)